jgi:hypothetical protein
MRPLASFYEKNPMDLQKENGFVLPVRHERRMIYARRCMMRKTKVNITLDKDLVEFAKGYAAEQRTTVSEIVGQFILNLKRTKEREPTEIILSDPDFTNGLLDTLSEIRSGKMKWHGYDEVFQ